MVLKFIEYLLLLKVKAILLLAFAEARKARSNGDSGDIDLVVKRSIG